jgi:protein-disulfide isomerase
VPITRREFCQTTALVTLGAAVAGTIPLSLASAAEPQGTVNEAELMQPGPLPDRLLGNPNAPVTIVEYASSTCPHCAHFQEQTFPALKKKYIDTGKVKYVFREFPLGSGDSLALAVAAFALARCAGELDSNKYYAMIDTIFAQQDRWAVERPIPPLLAMAKQAGFTEKSFEACIDNTKLQRDMLASRDRAYEKFGVNSTPTFFINGKRYVGALPIGDFDKAIEAALGDQNKKG